MNMLNWAHWIQKWCFLCCEEQGLRSWLLRAFTSPALDSPAWGHHDIRQHVPSAIPSFLDVVQDTLKTECTCDVPAWSQPADTSAQYEGLNDRSLRLEQRDVDAPGLSTMHAETRVPWPALTARWWGRWHKAQSVLQGFSEVHAWVWVWIRSIMLGGMRSCELSSPPSEWRASS